MKIKHIWMLPVVSFAANTSAFSQAVAEAVVPAAEKVNKGALQFDAQKSDKMLDDLAKWIEDTAEKSDKKVDGKKILNILGLDSVSSYAMSSEKHDTEWLNQIYLHDNGVNKGIFSLFGGKSAEYTVPTMCPRGTDLASQMKLNLGNVQEIIRELMIASDVDDSDLDEFDERMAIDVPGLGMNVSDMLKKVDINVNLALDLDNTQKLPLPDPIGAIDKPRLVIRLDNVKWLWATLDAQLQAPMIGLERAEKDGVITYNLGEEMGMMAKPFGYAPLLSMDTKSGQLWISSSADFLKLCMSGENTLAEDKGFQATMQGVAQKGNALSYMSTDFVDLILKKGGDLKDKGMIPDMPETDEMFKQLKLVKIGIASAYTRDETGAHFTSRTTQSIEEQIEEMKKQLGKVMEEIE